MPGAGAWIRPYRDGFRVYFRHEPGGVLHGSRVFPTTQAADVLADEIRAQITTKRRTIADALETYRKDMDARGLRSARAIERGIRLVIGSMESSPLTMLTSRRCDSLYQSFIASDEYSVGTHHLCLDTLKTFGKWCAHRRRRWLRENPFAAIEKVGARADRRSESLRVDEARKFREKALALGGAGDEGAVAALLALVTSMRPSEIVQIQGRDVDDGGAILWVAGARLKNANTRRPIEVADVELRALLVQLATGRAPTDRLIPHHRNFVADSAKRIADAAGVPSVTARELRRTFATLAARRGRSLDDLAFSMGHGDDANARTAQKHYIAPGAREAGAAGRVLGILDGGRGKKGVKRTA